MARPQLNLFLDPALHAEVLAAAAGDLQKPSAFGKLLFHYAWEEYKRTGSLKQLYARAKAPKRTRAKPV